MLAGPFGAREYEPDLDLHVSARAPVLHHRAVGADPDVARHRSAAVPLGMGTEHRLGASHHLRLDAGTFLRDPGVELAVAHPQAAQFDEGAGGLGIGELGHEPECPLPDAQAVLHPGRQAERLVERHDSAAQAPQR